MSDKSPLDSKSNNNRQNSGVNGNTGNDTGKVLPIKSKRKSNSRWMMIVLFLLVTGAVAYYLVYNVDKGSDRNIFQTAFAAWEKFIGNTDKDSGKVDGPTTAEMQAQILRLLARDANPAGNSAFVDSKQEAAGQRALDLGRKALNAGQSDVALLYFINGVSHDPGRMELVKSLAEAALKSGNNELCERSIGILELATMQVAPDDMAVVLDRIAELRARIAPPPLAKLSPDDANKRIQEIYKIYTPGTIWSDNAKVTSGLSDIEFLWQMIDLSQVDGNDARYSGAVQKAVELTEDLQNILNSLPLYLHINACVEQMEALVKSDVPDVALYSSLSASAQGVLSQVWGNMDLLPNEMQAGFQAFPAKMKEIEENFQDKTSKVPYERAVNFLDQAEADQKGNLTARIERIEDSLEKVSIEANSITSKKMRYRLFAKMRKTREQLMELEIDRRAAYQKWALKCVKGFLTDWNNQKSVSDKEAIAFFKKHSISRIDETLLLPAIARLFGRVIVCMTGELNAVDGSEIEFDIASIHKVRLEKF